MEMMVSKAGKSIEMAKKARSVRMRTETVAAVYQRADQPDRGWASGARGWCRPTRTSRVLMMGRALRGIFVRGMIAMKVHIRRVRTLG